MDKPLIQLDEGSRSRFPVVAEAGMGYYALEGTMEGEDEPRLFFVTGDDHFVLPLNHESYFSLADYYPLEAAIQGKRGWVESLTRQRVLRDIVFDRTSALTNFALLPGYSPAVGAMPLLGSVTLTQTANFYRYIRQATDSRFDDQRQVLAQDTYLTTANDQSYANTGFAAVGRYALPIPVPACNVFTYQLQQGTQLRIGTVCPNFGQAGGGVEVRLVKDAAITFRAKNVLPEY